MGDNVERRKRATLGTPTKGKGPGVPSSPSRLSKHQRRGGFEELLAQVDTNNKVDCAPTAAKASNGDEPTVPRAKDIATSSPEVMAR
jgi:hypothetical protein